MIAMILVHPHIFWLSLGGSVTGRRDAGRQRLSVLWSGVAAVITGLVVWLVPLDWAWPGHVRRPHPAGGLAAGGSGWQDAFRSSSRPTAILNQRGQQLSWPSIYSGN